MPRAEPAELRVEPFDQFNRRLVANVRPPDWVNPAPRERYDLVVIGAGTAGLVTAAIAAGLGAHVALVERHLMGGDCLNVGCVPSKAIIAAARGWHSAGLAAARFAGPRTPGTGDFAEVMARMRRLRADLSPVDSAARFRGLGVDVFFGGGRFVSPAAVQVAEATLRFRRAVIATGSSPAVAQIPGLERAGFLTNESIFSLAEAPAHLCVIGAGPVGCELAQAFARLGTPVTLIARGPTILPREDPDASRIVEQAMAQDGVRVLHEARVIRVETRGDRTVVSVERAGRIEEIGADRILVAVGRVPNVAGLGLETAAVRYDRSGIRVNDRLRTSNRRVFAIGDVSSVHRYTHVADAQARIVVGNALFHGIGGGRASRLVIPRVTYTSPEVAHVGLDPRAIAERAIEAHTITVPMRDADRAVLEGEEDGFFRVHLRKGSDRILGATLVAEQAGEMIGEITVAMTSGLGLSRVGAAIHPYPTRAEVFRKAADAWRRTRLTPRAKRIVEAVLRALR
jgi:pyruvate/2-oxoglutarate dehydrogenase complex dihydrolipoamide dehydrogenase (E3) component